MAPITIRLALERRRYRYRDAKLRAAHHHHDHAAIHKWGTLLARSVGVIRQLEQRIASRHPARPETWYPGAEHRPRASSGPYASGYAAKNLIHTTDGSSDATSTLDGNRDWPHFEVLENGHVIQYVPINLASSSLRHVGSPETNHANVVQTEIVGFETGRWPAGQIQAMRRLCRFIEVNHRVDRVCTVKFHPADGVRLSGEQWRNLRGYCGHCHVPGNDHQDPGPIDVTGVLAALLS